MAPPYPAYPQIYALHFTRIIDAPHLAHNPNVMSRVPITDEIREELHHLREQTNVGPARLLRGKSDRPKGLNSGLIKNWLSGHTKTADKHFLVYVCDLWEQILKEQKRPDQLSNFSMTQITPEIRCKLKDLKSKTGVSPGVFIKFREDRPTGLRLADIQHWMLGNRTRAITAHLEYVIDLWEQHPPIIAYTEQHKRDIQKEISRTGATVGFVFNHLNNPPDGFTRSILNRLMNGIENKTWQTHIDYLLAVLRSLPDAETLPLQTNARPIRSNQTIDDYIVITQAHRDTLLAQRERTGMAATAFIRHFKAQKPDKISANTLFSWINGSCRTASKARLAWVIEHYRSLPDQD